MRSALISVGDSSRVAEARREALVLGEAEGLSPNACQQLAIIATEAATNLLKHARSGELHLNCLSSYGEPGVEILSIDRGPGMANLQNCVADGYSTAGTQGTGLGAIRRQADVFDAYTQLGKGTVLVARKYRDARRETRKSGWSFAAIRVPYPGEQACGDNWGLHQDGRGLSLIVADGLGHGVLAAEASTAAVAAFHKRTTATAAEMLEEVHLALRSTRGAAVSVASIDPTGNCVQYAGLGNIVGVLLGGLRSQFMVSHNGTAGLEARRVQQFDYVMPPNAVLVMHSDGLTTSWSIDAYPGLLRKHPALVAAVLYRDANRGRDDVCVVAGRWMHE